MGKTIARLSLKRSLLNVFSPRVYCTFWYDTGMKKESVYFKQGGKPLLFSIIPAAGVGSRMEAELPKQYLKLGEKTVLEQTLKTFLASDYLTQAVVVLSKEDPYFELGAFSLKEQEKLLRAEGGATRADSVFKGLLKIREQLTQVLGEVEGEQYLAKTWVMVHDAARPGLTTRELEDFISYVWDHAPKTGAIMALPAQDTIKQVEKGKITTTLDRERIWLAQTPQMVRFNDLYLGTQKALAAGVNVTDEASILEYNGIFPAVYPGKPHNFKITYPNDLDLMRLIIEHRKSEKKRR